MNPLRILLADDHDIVREGLRRVLQARPDWVICDEAATGREAVDKAKKHRPDVVVLDFSMPDLNGLEATRQIRSALPQTEVLILTMHESEQLAQALLLAGARGFVTKTDVKRHLFAAVEALAQHKPFFAPTLPAALLETLLHSEQHPAGTRASRSAAPDHLTPREREIVQLIAEGGKSKEIAATLGLRCKTVDAHRANIMNKLHLRSVGELVRYAVRNRIIQP